MWQVLLVALGGAIGATLRFSLSSLVAYRWTQVFPLGTLIVNILGCFVVSYLFVKGITSGALSNNWRLFLIVGIGGAFTTFSSFSLETVQLLREGLYVTAVYNVLGNMCLCIVAAIAGMGCAKF